MSPVITTSYCTIATAGHVDHGKTSLIKALTGINPDRLKEEQERQMTTDLGFAHLDFEPDKNNVKFVLGFIDVPGHGKFLKNMLAGVGGIDTALLVVAADEGPMPQTVQHVKILSLLGVKSCVLALTKIDLVQEKEGDASSNSAADTKIASVQAKVSELLNQYGIALLDAYPVSTVSSKGVDALKAGLYKHLNQSTSTSAPRTTNLATSESVDLGANHISNAQDAETMLYAEAEAAVQAGVKVESEAEKSAAAILRSVYMPVDRVFTKSGFGLVVTGTLIQGELNTGDHITVEPGSVKARVRGMESFGESINKATPGQRLAVNLAVKDGGTIARGQSIAGSDWPIVHNLIVEVIDHGGLEFAGDAGEDKHVSLSPQPIKLYHGTAEAKGTLRWLENVEADDQTENTAKYTGKRFGQIFLTDPIVAKPENNYVIRYGDEGIAGGAILLTDRPRWLTRQLVHDVSAALIENTPDSQKLAFVLTVAAHPLKAIKLSQLTWVMPLLKLEFAAEAALADGLIVSIADLYMAVSTREQIGEKILALLQTLMANEDNARFGVSIETMRKKTFNTLTRPVMQAIVADLAGKGMLAREGDRIFTNDRADNDYFESGFETGSEIESTESSVPIMNAAGNAMAKTYASLLEPVDPATQAAAPTASVKPGSTPGAVSKSAPLSPGSTASTASTGSSDSAPASSASDPTFAQTNRLRDQIMSILNQHPCLEIEDVAKQVKLDVKKLNLVLDGMVKNKQVHIIDHDFVATANKLKAAHNVLHKLWTTKKDISPSDFREGLSTTRKYAMALLSHFDEKGVTKRVTGGRALLKMPE